MIRRLALALLALSLGGCFRLSDPFYAFKSLRADDPERPGDSLVFGTIQIDGAMTKIDTIALRRVRPFPEDAWPGATEAIVFRAFRTRSMKDGHFLVELPPGAYELVELAGGIWGQAATFHPDDSARKASRFHVTKPGIYDLGIIKIEASAWTPYGSMSWQAPKDRAERAQLVRDAVKGTGWERFAKDRSKEGLAL